MKQMALKELEVKCPNGMRCHAYFTAEIFKIILMLVPKNKDSFLKVLAEGHSGLQENLSQIH